MKKKHLMRVVLACLGIGASATARRVVGRFTLLGGAPATKSQRGKGHGCCGGEARVWSHSGCQEHDRSEEQRSRLCVTGRSKVVPIRRRSTAERRAAGRQKKRR